ncbi:MAG: exonuclease [Bacteroidia bacterium]|nr:exonuclease [Bacteroidia bacterium]
MEESRFIKRNKEGLYCEAGAFFLDPRKPVYHALISHAHGDHAIPNNGVAFTTHATRSLMEKRFLRNLKSHFNLVEYGKPFQMKDVKVTFFPAGHILGSAQILMEFNGGRYLYTGDYKLQHDESCHSFELVACDHLITETTFAQPGYQHPDPVEEIKTLNRLDKNIVIGAYSVGKAQRLTQLISRHCPEKKIMVHQDMAKFHSVYEKYGFHLGNYSVYRRVDFKEGNNMVYIIPPQDFTRFTRNKSVVRLFATGWKKIGTRSGGVLSISDHADWKGILHLIDKSGAKNVFTVHGDGTYLKNHFEGKNLNVYILA